MLPASTPCYSKVTHCIFDNDGTLMDTEHKYGEAMENVMKKFQVPFPLQLKLRVTGRASREAAKFLCQEVDMPVNEERIEYEYVTEMRRLLKDIKPMPGARDLLVHLHEQRVPMAIATSSPQKLFRQVWEPHCDMMSVLRHIVCGDDPQLARVKPAPDIYFLAASRFNPAPRPECCLVFEDSPVGMRAAVAAGMQVVMIPDPRLSPEVTKGATLVLKSLADFEPELFGLPAYDYGEKFTFG